MTINCPGNPGLDRYRIQSIVSILESHRLTPQYYQAAVDVLREKCRIYADGCIKRGRADEAEFYRQIMADIDIVQENDFNPRVWGI